jgi:hypothetical protein
MSGAQADWDLHQAIQRKARKASKGGNDSRAPYLLSARHRRLGDAGTSPWSRMAFLGLTKDVD